MNASAANSATHDREGVALHPIPALEQRYGEYDLDRQRDERRADDHDDDFLKPSQNLLIEECEQSDWRGKRHDTDQFGFRRLDSKPRYHRRGKQDDAARRDYSGRGQRQRRQQRQFADVFVLALREIFGNEAQGGLSDPEADETRQCHNRCFHESKEAELVHAQHTRDINLKRKARNKRENIAGEHDDRLAGDGNPHS